MWLSQFGIIVLAVIMGPIMSEKVHASTLLQKLLENRGIVHNDIAPQVNQSQQNEQIKKEKAEKTEKKDIPSDTVDLKEIEKQAEYASQKTGVRKDFLMGMLVVESGLGQNMGQCTYKEVADGAEAAHARGSLSRQAWNTFQKRKITLTSIAENLGYDPEKIKVSCNPGTSVYAGTGGAMGVSQFMPDTWLEYAERIAAITGNEHPDPWDTRDGVMAMALKVSDVPGVTEHNVWAEKAASKMYLSGNTSWQYDWYANQIQYWAKNYSTLIG